MLGLHRLLRRWHARKGRLVVLPSVPSPELDNRRDLYIYVPAAPARGDSRYPVIYMQDGQNLFDPAQSFAGTWGVDEALSWASRRGLDAIVVGIPNMGDARIAEYDPFMGTGDRYLDFVTHTVKPIVDAQFPTLPDRRHTGIAGSSMGGLISLYAFFRYSESFGFAAALSPSLWFADGAPPVARPAAREGLRWGARLSLGGGQGRRAPRVGVGPSLPRGPPVPAAGSGDVKHAHHKWYSPALGRDMELQVLGHAGARVLVFPTSLGSYSEWTDRRMDRPGVLGEHLENGWIQMFCLHHVHEESWYGEHLHPGARAWRHLQYDRYLRDEVIPFSAGENPNPFVMAVGASFGAYHAACFGLRNPHLVNRIIGLSGLYDITRLTGGYSDANVYACNPFDFMRHEHDAARLEAFRRQDIILAIGRDDPACGNNQEFSGTLWGKGIGNALRIWDGWSHDWPYWEKMIRLYIGGHD